MNSVSPVEEGTLGPMPFYVYSYSSTDLKILFPPSKANTEWKRLDEILVYAKMQDKVGTMSSQCRMFFFVLRWCYKIA